MENLQIARNALRVINEIINKMYNPDNWVNHGICGEVNNQMDGMFEEDMKYKVRSLIKDITQGWSHYSGDVTYPVPASINGSDRRGPDTAFTSACAAHDSKAALWAKDNLYGRARWALMYYIRDTLNGQIAHAETIRYTDDNGQSLGDILSAALNNQTERTNAMDTNVDTSTLKGKLAVMQAADRGEKIEYRHHDDEEWSISQGFSNADLGFHWGDWEYRIYQAPKVKDTFDFAGLNQKWKYAARDENGSLYIYEKKPIVESSVWSVMGFDSDSMRITDVFETYKIGDVDWKDSLISRDEIDTLPRHITDLIRNGHIISAIKEHHQQFSTGLREAKDAVDAWREANIPNWRNNR